MNLKSYLKNKQIQQSILLLFSSAAVMVVTLCINFFLTKTLTKENFGNYSLIINIFIFSQVIFNFGFFYSLGRVVALTESTAKQQEYYAVGLLYTMAIYFLLFIVLIVYNYFYFHDNPKMFSALLVSIPFGWLYLITSFYENILQGSNKINLLACVRFLPKFVFLVFILFSFYTLKAYITLNNVLVLYFTSYFLAYVYVISKLKPKFQNISSRIREVQKANKEYGFNIYIGSLLSVGAANLAGILIGHFGVNNIEVGYYTIALQLAIPLALIPNILATSYFKSFVNSKKIEKKTLLLMIFMSCFLFLLVMFFSKPLILLIYGDNYIASVHLLRYLAVGSILYGVADFFTKFLLAHGKGKELRNASFLVGVVLLLSNIILIKLAGANGAALSKVLAGLTYLLTILFYYNRITKVYDAKN